MTEGRLSQAAARDLTRRIGGLMGEIEDLVIQAWRGWADEALGYKSWEEYISTEVPDLPRFNLPERQKVVKNLTERSAQTERGQMTANEVAATVNTSPRTVERSRSRDRQMADPTSTSNVVPLKRKKFPEPVRELTPKEQTIFNACDADLNGEIGSLEFLITRLTAFNPRDFNSNQLRRVRAALKKGSDHFGNAPSAS